MQVRPKNWAYTLWAIPDPYLLLKSGYDFGELQKNLTLLQAYKEDGQITLQDIKEVVPKSLQDNIFDLTQMILKGQIDQARNLVKDLRLQGEDEIKLIAILLEQFRMFSQVKIFSEEGQSESQIVANLSDLSGRKVNPYQVKFALRDSRRLSYPLKCYDDLHRDGLCD